MAEPATTTAATAISLKWGMVTLGSAIGSAISLAFAPAKNHKDAAFRFAMCAATTMMIAPAITRLVARWTDASVDSIPDITLATAGILGIVSWSLLAAIHKFGAKHFDSIAEEGFAGLVRIIVGGFTRTKAEK